MTDYEAAFRTLTDKWHESVKHYEARIEKLEEEIGVLFAANVRLNSRADLDSDGYADRIEKLEAALDDMAQYVSRADWHYLKDETRKALEGKDA